MAAALDQKIREDLAKEFNVSEATCDEYNRIYNEVILPRIQKKYLAHMVIAVEEMIDEVIRIREKTKKTDDLSKSDAEPPKVRRYSIVLSDRLPPTKGNAYTWSLVQGAIITYKPNDPDQDLRIFVAHELGHLLIEYGILPFQGEKNSKDAENHANLLAFCAISGKNDFYVNKAPKLIYKNGDTDILERIKKLCRT